MQVYLQLKQLIFGGMLIVFLFLKQKNIFLTAISIALCNVKIIAKCICLLKYSKNTDQNVNP